MGLYSSALENLLISVKDCLDLEVAFHTKSCLLDIYTLLAATVKTSLGPPSSNQGVSAESPQGDGSTRPETSNSGPQPPTNQNEEEDEQGLF